jgi:hypothetical protein
LIQKLEHLQQQLQVVQQEVKELQEQLQRATHNNLTINTSKNLPSGVDYGYNYSDIDNSLDTEDNPSNQTIYLEQTKQSNAPALPSQSQPATHPQSNQTISIPSPVAPRYSPVIERITQHNSMVVEEVHNILCFLLLTVCRMQIHCQELKNRQCLLMTASH